MDVLRTPSDRFDDLPDYPFAPNYLEVPAGDDDGTMLRVHYLDEGPIDGPVVVLLHGEPTWSYLYRRMIPALVDAGLRCIAPDLPGFGRSDKPTERTDYTYQRHVDWMRGLLFDLLDLRDVTLFGQDWGGLIGLRLVAEHPDRFARVVASNTMLPTGDHDPGEGFQRWKKFSQETPEFPVGRIVDGGCLRKLTDEEIAAYDAPFPDDSYKACARQFPVLVPVTPDDPASDANRRAWTSLEQFDKPFLTAFGDSDVVLGRAYGPLRERIPGAHGQPHTIVEGAAHFIQEDKGPELARIIADFVAATT